MISVDRIAFGGVLSLSKKISKIRHSTVTLVLTTITEVLTDAHIEQRGGHHDEMPTPNAKCSTSVLLGLEYPRCAPGP